MPQPKPYRNQINHAPKRKEILNEEKKVSSKNALRYFRPKFHAELLPEFREELENMAEFTCIVFVRLRNVCKTNFRISRAKIFTSRNLLCSWFKIIWAMQWRNILMNWLLRWKWCSFPKLGAISFDYKYLSEMTDEQTLVMYSGHQWDYFQVIKMLQELFKPMEWWFPNYSKPDDWENLMLWEFLSMDKWRQGSYMYIGCKRIVHRNYNYSSNAFRKIKKRTKGRLFVTSGLGGMSGAQPKAGNIAGCITVCAEVKS